MLSVAIILGTRPEAVKLASVIDALKKTTYGYKITTIATGQHREVFDITAAALGIPIDINLGLQRHGQSLAALSALLLSSLDDSFASLAPDLVIVQGDTQTAVMAALAASSRRIPVAHVEAGLRSGNNAAPYPEEVNRRIIALAAELHFAPTSRARNNLLAEGIDPAKIVVTGNTVIDSLRKFTPREQRRSALADNGRKILVTCHRRESWGKGVDNICNALLIISNHIPDVEILFILPLAPDIRQHIIRKLGAVYSVTLSDPLPYPDFLARMSEASLILTDSGGVQEEAPTLGVPTILMRDVCDRPEGLNGITSVMSGTDCASIVASSLRMLGLNLQRETTSPYGDGCAADRIVRAINRWQQGDRPLLSPADSFAG